MAEDGTEPGIIAAQGRREMPKTGEDCRGWYGTWHHSCTREEGDALRQQKMAEDIGTEPGIIVAQGRRETPKTGEDGRGWYRTWHHSCTREEGDA